MVCQQIPWPNQLNYMSKNFDQKIKSTVKVIFQFTAGEFNILKITIINGSKKLISLKQGWETSWRNSLNFLKKPIFSQNYQVKSLLWDRLVWKGCTEGILCLARGPDTKSCLTEICAFKHSKQLSSATLSNQSLLRP